MKNLFIIGTILFLFWSNLSAQDIIITKDAKKIEAKILEVSSTEIKYKKQSNLEGPTFVVSTSELNTIIYANGEVQLFSKQQKTQQVPPASTTTTPTQPVVTKPIPATTNPKVETQVNTIPVQQAQTTTSKETDTHIYYATQYKGQSLPVFTYQKVLVPYYKTPKYRYVADNMVFTEGEFLKFCKIHCYEAYKYKDDISTALSVYNRTCAGKGNVEEEQNTYTSNPQQFDKNRSVITNPIDIQTDNQRPFIKRAFFNMYFDAGMIVSGNGGLGATTNLTFGSRIKDYVFIGGSIGYDYFSDEQYYYDYTWRYNWTDIHVVTEMLNVRVFIPAKPKIYPYIETSIGSSVVCNIYNSAPMLLRLKVGSGIDASRFSFGLGYDFLCGSSFVNRWGKYVDLYSIHSFYFKFGVRIGRME